MFKSKFKYFHPVTKMKYTKINDEYFFKSAWQKGIFDNLIKSGMKRGFVLLK